MSPAAATQSNTRRTILGYELSYHQDAYVNYLTPSITSCLLFIFLFTSDAIVVYRHFRDENPIWASLTLFFMYFPVLGCYILTISLWELWPELEGCGIANLKWLALKTLQHIFFPVWACWRFAERIFWSIEAVRSQDENAFKEATSVVTAPRTIEQYFFLQAFLQSLPQMLLQLNTIMRRDEDMDKATADIQILSLVLNLCKLSATITFYQRFKTQKVAGKQYPWFKPYKKPLDATIDQVDSNLETEECQLRRDREEAGPSVSRRSSDFYMEPNPPPLKDLVEVAGCLRETSVVDGPQRRLYTEVSQPDFNIRRLTYIRGMPEDDLVGKLVAFCWWFCFLLARILAISAFGYFYPSQTFWLLFSHFIIVIAFLIYDAKTDRAIRAKALFFVFIGLIYIFCIIEFKIRFKKAKFIYYGYFILVFGQNFIMCLIWWLKNVEDIENDFWFRYIFYFVVMCSLISFTSMLLYLNVNKPKKVVVGTAVL